MKKCLQTPQKRITKHIGLCASSVVKKISRNEDYRKGRMFNNITIEFFSIFDFADILYYSRRAQPDAFSGFLSRCLMNSIDINYQLLLPFVLCHTLHSYLNIVMKVFSLQSCRLQSKPSQQGRKRRDPRGMLVYRVIYLADAPTLQRILVSGPQQTSARNPATVSVLLRCRLMKS